MNCSLKRLDQSRLISKMACRKKMRIQNPNKADIKTNAKLKNKSLLLIRSLPASLLNSKLCSNKALQSLSLRDLMFPNGPLYFLSNHRNLKSRSTLKLKMISSTITGKPFRLKEKATSLKTQEP